MNQTDIIELAGRVLIKNYRQQPVVMQRGEGAYLWDAAGKRYLDMTAGIAVCALGHAHPGLTAALRQQVGELLHVSNLYFNGPQVLAADAIVRHSFADRVFFCNSGAEANEAALKLARRYQSEVVGQPARIKIVATNGAFHGRSIGTVSITGQVKYRDGFGPLFGPVEFINYGDAAAAERALSSPDACAIIVEPVQAEGGVIVPPAGYLAALRAICDRTGTLLIFDEVQTGMGRTGTWFGYQADDVAPDVMTLAKGLGGGVPIGAIAASERAARGLALGDNGIVPHATTFGGNPLACAAAVAVFNIIEAEGLLANAAAMGAYLGERLSELVGKFPRLVTEARGRGLLRGLVVTVPPATITAACRERGLLLSMAGSNVVRFVPPLIITRAQIDDALAILTAVLAEVPVP